MPESLHVYSEVSSILWNEIYSQESLEFQPECWCQILAYAWGQIPAAPSVTVRGDPDVRFEN